MVGGERARSRLGGNPRRASLGGWRSWPADVMLGVARFFLALLAFGEAAIGRGWDEHG
jgi:hypothetical protein